MGTMPSANRKPLLQLQHLTKTYPDGTTAVHDVSLNVPRGACVVLLGPSGSGKTTTLRMMNRLVEPSAGTVIFEGRDYRTLNPIVLRRRMGYVIQQIGLLPHLTVGENIAFVLRLLGFSYARRRDRAAELLTLVGLDPGTYLDRYPSMLSGGQQQRIGVLRALAHDPDIILMDEPFGALDPITRRQLQAELKRLQHDLGKTVVFVTHDLDEALTLGDTLVLLRDGRILQQGDPDAFLQQPADAFVAAFVGRTRRLHRAALLPVGHSVRRAVTVPPSTSAASALAHMRASHSDVVCVVDADGRYRGMVTRAALHGQADRQSSTVGDLAHRTVTIAPTTPAIQAMHLLLHHQLPLVPVTEDDGRLVGILTRRDLVDRVGEWLADADAVGVEQPAASQPW